MAVPQEPKVWLEINAELQGTSCCGAIARRWDSGIERAGYGWLEMEPAWKTPMLQVTPKSVALAYCRTIKRCIASGDSAL